MGISPSMIFKQTEEYSAALAEAIIWHDRINTELIENYVHGTTYIFKFDKYPIIKLFNEDRVSDLVVSLLIRWFKLDDWYVNKKYTVYPNVPHPTLKGETVGYTVLTGLSFNSLPMV